MTTAGNDPVWPVPMGSLGLPPGASDQNTLRRGISTLWHLAQHDSLSVTELASLLPCDKSQASRVLKVLAEYELVVRDPDTRRYSLGWLVFAFSLRVSGRRMLSIAGPIIQQLAASTGETSWLAVLSGHDVLNLYTSRPKGASLADGEWAGVPPGGVVPLSASASGRVLMSGLDDDAIERLLADGGIGGGSLPGGQYAPQDFITALRSDQRRGYSIVVDDLKPGTTTAAAAVRDASGLPLLAVGVSGSNEHMARQEQEIVQQLRRAVTLIGSSLSADRAASRPL